MKRVISLALLFLLSSCYSIQYRHSKATPASFQSSVWHNHVVDGVVETSKAVRVDQVCPNGVASIENEVTFVNALASVGTQLGIGVAAILAFMGVDDDGTASANALLLSQSIWWW